MTDKLQKRILNFINKANIKYYNKFNYSKVYHTFKNSDSVIIVICPIHGEFKTTPNSHLYSKTGCKLCGIESRLKSTKKYIDIFIAKARNKHGNKFDYSNIIDLQNENSEIGLICPIHGKFEIEANKHIESKYGCKLCGIENRNNATRKTTSEFIAECYAKYGNEYDYSKVKYINAVTDVTIICPTHGEFKKTPNNHLSGQVCDKCNKESFVHHSVVTYDAFINKCNNKYKGKYQYIEHTFVNMTTKMNIICPIHGEFEMQPFNHLNSETGCTKCGRLLNNKRRIKTKDHFIKKARNRHGDKYDYSMVQYINDQTNVTIICPIHGEFNQTPNNHSYATGCPKCSHYHSKAESEIIDLIPNALQNDRSFIQPYELDILSHKHKLAIEFNGLLWHSYGNTYPSNLDKWNLKYHLNKTNLVEKKGYQLFHIFENEWLDPIKQEIWKSMINSKLDNTKRIYARKCTIAKISNDDYKSFMISNHMQGYRNASVKIGLIYNTELIACISFSKPIFTKNVEYELVRFCNKVNHTIVGGASKLLKYFERNYNPKSIVSYANRRWSQGNLYKQIGFSEVRITEPNYFYIDKKLNMYSRNQFQKHMLKDKLNIFDESMSEIDNMINNDYRIIFDSGNITYLKEN